MARTPVLTDKQKKFAELLVYNEGRKSPAECAQAAGYTTRFDAATTSYYSQEFPNGTPATRITYYLKINQT